MEARPLTGQQQRVLEFLEQHGRDHGFPPTYREIGQAIGVGNVNAVRGHIAALEKKGYISRLPEKARSIQIVRHAPSPLSRLRRQLHRWARTDEGVLHRVCYGLALVTWRRTLSFVGPLAEKLNDVLDREAVEHGWTIERREIHADHLVLVVRAWPSQSPQQTARRIRAAGEALARRLGVAGPGRRLWARGYAVTTDSALLDELTQELLRQVTPTPETA